MSGNPKDLIESGGTGQEGGAPLPDAPATEALQELTQNVTDAVGAMQDMGDLLTEKARQLHEHESVLATRDQYGHFKPGAGFTFDPATQSYNIDALSGVETLAGNVLNDFKAEIDASTIVHQQGLDKALSEALQGLDARRFYQVADTTPEDVSRLWVHSLEHTLHYHNGSQWVPVVGVYVETAEEACSNPQGASPAN